MLEYANNGLIGLLTPQANTTAEAELSILFLVRLVFIKVIYIPKLLALGYSFFY